MKGFACVIAILMICGAGAGTAASAGSSRLIGEVTTDLVLSAIDADSIVLVLSFSRYSRW